MESATRDDDKVDGVGMLESGLRIDALGKLFASTEDELVLKGRTRLCSPLGTEAAAETITLCEGWGVLS